MIVYVHAGTYMHEIQNGVTCIAIGNHHLLCILIIA